MFNENASISTLTMKSKASINPIASALDAFVGSLIKTEPRTVLNRQLDVVEFHHDFLEQQQKKGSLILKNGNKSDSELFDDLSILKTQDPSLHSEEELYHWGVFSID